jgi:MFS transporter, DHA1 family, inner membrane transport protein
MKSSPQPWRILLGAAAATGICNASWWMQPQIVAQAMKVPGTTESQAGFVVAAEFGAMAILSVVLAQRVRNASYFTIGVVGSLVTLLGAFGSLAATSYGSLILARFVTGTGEGAALMVSTAAVANLAYPDKAYAQLNIVNILLGAAITFLLPEFASTDGQFSSAFSVLLISQIIFLIAILAMPRSVRTRPEHHHAGAEIHGSVRYRIRIVALATFLVALGSGAMWSFYYVLGLKAGLTDDAVNDAIGVAVLSALPGGALATYLATRAGRFTPTAVVLIVMAGDIAAMVSIPHALVFRVGACINLAAIYFLIPYFYRFAAAEDDSGRGAAVVGGAFLLVGAVGPYMGGLLIQHLGLHSIVWLVLAANVVALAMFYWLDRTLSSAERGNKSPTSNRPIDVWKSEV